jgi:putative membrane-bound dehydrogenase-like protein
MMDGLNLMFRPSILITDLYSETLAKEAIERMTVPGDLQVNLFASEQDFPGIVNPVALQVDTRGRIWVASWGNYPKQKPLSALNDRLVTLTDEDGDGAADKATTFAYVPHPTGFEFWNDGVVVASAPYILYLKDTTGDGVADVRTRLFGGIGADDTHHTANNLVYGPDGNIYYQRSSRRALPESILLCALFPGMPL